MSGTSTEPDTMIAENYKIAEIYEIAERASKKEWVEERIEVLQKWMKERKETFEKQFRAKYPDVGIKITQAVIDSAEKVWLDSSIIDSDVADEFEESLTFDLILQPVVEDFIKEANRTRPDPTYEKASKILRAQLKKNKIGVSEFTINEHARTLFTRAFKNKIREKYPNMNLKCNEHVVRAKERAWSCMSDSAKALYAGQVEMKLADELVCIEHPRKARR